MRKKCLTAVRPAILVGLMIGALCTSSFSQNDDTVLVPGNPSLTQLMAGKVIVLLDWALKLKLSKEQELQIKDMLIKTWRSKDQAEMRGALEIIEIYEKIFAMSEADRNGARGHLKELLLKSVRSQPDDELARKLLSAYQSVHSLSRF